MVWLRSTIVILFDPLVSDSYESLIHTRGDLKTFEF